MRPRMLWTAEEAGYAFAVSWTSAHATLDDTVAPILSDKTVRNYVSGLLTKLQVPGRAAAVAAARDAGYGAGHPREEPTSRTASPELKTE